MTKRKPDSKRKLRPKKGKSINRKKIIGRLKVIAILGGAALFVVGIILLCLFVVFKVNVVTVSGDSPYTVEDVVRISGIQQGENLMMVSSGKAEKNIIAAMPYVQSVKVKKKLSGTVEIEIIPETVFSSVESGGQYVYLSRSGKILQLADSFYTGSIEVLGMELESPAPLGTLKSVEDNRLDIYNSIVDAIEKAGHLEDFTKIDIIDIYNIRIMYQDRITFILGNASDLDVKLNFGLSEKSIETYGNDVGGVMNLEDAKAINKVYYTPPGSTSSAVASSKPENSESSADEADSSGDNYEGETDYTENGGEDTGYETDGTGESGYDDGADEGYSGDGEDAVGDEGGYNDGEDSAYDDGTGEITGDEAA